jgi:hypothetical protein
MNVLEEAKKDWEKMALLRAELMSLFPKLKIDKPSPPMSYDEEKKADAAA